MCIFPPSGRTWPVSLGSGLGLGMGCANCQHDFKSPYLVHMLKASKTAEMCCLGF